MGNEQPMGHQQTLPAASHDIAQTFKFVSVRLLNFHSCLLPSKDGDV